MPLITQGKTNWKYILSLLILAIIVGGGISGYLKYFEREIESLTKFLEIKKPEKLIKDETANWKTYRNEEYGFEIRYPSFLEGGDPGCNINEIEDTIFIGPISLVVLDIQGLTLNEWINREIAKAEKETKEMQERFRQAGYENWQEFGYKLLSREEIFIGGERAVKLSYQFIGAGFDLPVTIYIEKGNRIYEFQTNDANLVDEGCAAKFGDKKPSEVMELILSTFRFIETEKTANWKTYRNEEYGFEIKYPPTCLMEAERKNESLHIEFHAKTQEDFYICTGGFSVGKNERKLPLEEALEDLYGFYDLRFEKIEAPSGIVALKLAKEQSEEYYKKFGPLGSGLEYNYWITGNDKWIFFLYHFQDGGLLADQMLSTFRFLK